MQFSYLIAFFTSLYLHTSKAWSIEHYYNFDGGSSVGWTVIDGSWSVNNLQYRIAAYSYGGKARITNSNYSALMLDADVTVHSGNYDAGLIFRATQISSGPDNYSGYYAYLDESGDKVVLVKNPGFNTIGASNKTILQGVKYRLSVVAVENRIRVFVDDKLYIDVDDATHAYGAIGATAYEASASFDNVFVSSETQGALRESFANGSGRWIPYDNAANFSIVNQAYKIASGSFGSKSILSNSESVDNIIHCDVTLNGYDDAGILFRVENPGSGIDNYNGYYAAITSSHFVLAQGPGYNILASTPNNNFTLGKTYHLRIETFGSLISIYVDGVKKIEVRSNTYIKGAIGVTAYTSEAIFDNFAIGANVASGLAKRAASQTGFYGTPNTWDVRTYNHGDFDPELTNMAERFRNKFRDTDFGWFYTSSNGGGNAFRYSDFGASSGAAVRAYDLTVAITHGNDGVFTDWSNNGIFLRSGYGAQSAILAKKNKYLIIIGCSSLYTGVAAPFDAKPYLPVMKGSHAILSYASKFGWYLGRGTLNKLVDYFIDNWHANRATGIFPAFRDASFKALYEGDGMGIAPAVVFTAGDMKGQHDTPRPYWGWEEKTWNIYNGAAYVSAEDKTNYVTEGEELVYNPNWGYPDKIGHKYAVAGNPDWSGITPRP